MRRDPGSDQPTETTASSISGVGREPLRLDPETPFGAIEHDLCRLNLVVGPCRRRLYVTEHRVLNIDEIITHIPELHTLAGLGGPGRAGGAWRDHLRRLTTGVGICTGLERSKIFSDSAGLAVGLCPY